MPMIHVKQVIFILVSSKGVGFDLPRPFYKFFILDLNEYLDDGGIEGRQYHIGSTRRGARTRSLIRP